MKHGIRSMKAKVVVTLAAAALLVPATGMAALSTTYAQYVVVAQGTRGDYNNLATALSNITDASPTKRYLIKVMPGDYTVSSPIQMKSYVDVEGSGTENTVITSSSNSADICTSGTVFMASNSVISNIKIVNNPPVLNGNGTASALVFNNTSNAKGENLSVVSGSMTVNGAENNGISLCGIATSASLNNVKVEAYSAGTHSNAIYMWDGANMVLTNSNLTAKIAGEGGATGINSDGPYVSNVGSVTVSDSSIDVTSPDMPHGIFAGGFKADISTTRIKLTGGTWTPDAFFAGPQFTMKYSTVEANSPVIYSYDSNITSVTRISYSKLPGDRAGLAGAKLTYCMDENGDPIPNQ